MSRYLHRVRGEDREAGQVPTAVAVVVFVFLLALAFRFALPLGQAADQKQTSQSAADAAALAGAKQIKDDLPEAVREALRSIRAPEDLLNLFDRLGAGLGRGKAEEYAGHNDASVVSYGFDRWNGLVSVEVRGHQASATGTHSESSSRVQLGVRFGACRLDADPTPSPTPSADPPDPDAPPAPEPSVGTVLRCGDLSLHVTFDGATGRPRLDTPLSDITDRIKPRIVD